MISNCPESISESQTRVKPTKQDEIKGVLEINMPTNIDRDKIVFKIEAFNTKENQLTPNNLK